MARVLIVNADTAFSMTLGFALTARKHNVEVARSGPHGLEIGFQIHPDVVIVDWMLAGPLDGLQVAEALSAALGTTRTVMVTGFPGAAVRSKASERGVLKVLDRSIGMEQLLGHVEEALQVAPRSGSLPLGYLQYEENGHGRYASPGFRRMFSVASNAPERGLVERIFSHYSKVSLLHSRNEWIDLKKRDAAVAEFTGFVKLGEDGSRSLLVLAKKDAALKDTPVVRNILGQMARPAIPGRFVIIDRDELQARLAKTQIESSGARCHAARSVEVGVEIVKADPEANTVLLDFRTAADVAESVRRLTAVRPAWSSWGCAPRIARRSSSQRAWTGSWSSRSSLRCCSGRSASRCRRADLKLTRVRGPVASWGRVRRRVFLTRTRSRSRSRSRMGGTANEPSSEEIRSRSHLESWGSSYA